jgi:hypothetical protein
MALAIDNLGRKIDTANMTLQDIKGLVATLMQKSAGPARPVREVAKEKGLPEPAVAPTDSAKTQEHITRIRELFEQYTKDFNKEVAEQKTHLQNVVNALKEINVLKDQKRQERKENQAKKDKKKKPDVSKEEKTMAKATDGVYKTISKKGSAYVHDIYVEAALKELSVTLKGIGGAAPAAPTTAAATPSPPPKAGGRGGSRGQKIQKRAEARRYQDIMHLRQMAVETAQFFKEVQEVTLGFDAWDAITQDLVKKEREFTQEVRAIAYETAGVTKEARSAQRAFEDIGKTTALTGMDRTKFQEEYKKSLKSGIKDLKQAVQLTTAQLNTENQLGMAAGALHDDFLSMAQAGRMNNAQIADMGRGMRDIARNTGLTGEALAGVIKSSKVWIDSLRSAANLTSAAAKNVMEVSANAKKLGIEQQISPILSAITSTNKLLFETSAQTQAMLFQAAGHVGRINDLLNGTLTRSKEGLADLAKGMRSILKQYGIDSLEQIDQLTDDAKSTINISLKAAYGLELGDMRSAIESVEESGKGLAGKLDKINKKLQENVTLEEKNALLEEQRALKTSKSLEVLTAMSEAAKGAKDMDQALATFGQRRKEFDKDLQAMGISATDNADVIRQTLQSALDNVNSGLKKSGKQTLKIDQSAIENALKDPVALRELTAQISKGEQQLATAQKAQLDPMSEMAQSLCEINDNLRQYTQKTFSMLFNSLIGKVVAIVGAVAGVTAGIMLLGVKMLALKETIKGFLVGHESMFRKMPGLVDVPRILFGSKYTPKEEAALEAEKQKKLMPTPPPAPKPPETPKPDAKPKLEAAPTPSPTPEKGKDVFEEMVQLLREIRDCVCKGMAKSEPGSPPPQGAVLAGKPEPAQQAAQAAAQARSQEDLKKLSPEERTKLLNEKLAKQKGITVEEVTTRRSSEAAAAARTSAPMAATEGARKQQKQEKRLSDAIINRKNKQEMRDVRFGDKRYKAEVQQSKTAQLESKNAKARRKQVQAEATAQPECPDIPSPDPNCFDVKSMMASGKEMAKAGAAILVLAAGVVILGAAMVFLAHKIIGAFGLDFKTVLETAAVVGAIAAAGGAIALAAVGVYQALESDETKKFVGGIKMGYKKVLKAAAAILILGPAMVVLGAAVVWLSQKVIKAFNLDLGTMAHTAATIAAIAGAASAITVAAAEALQKLEEMEGSPLGKKLLNNPRQLISKIWKAALAIILLGPALILLGAVIVKFAQWILGAFKLDAKTAMKVGLTVAAIIGAAGIIGLALAGATIGLYGLGLLVDKALADPTFLRHITAGALALLILGPAVVALASAIVLFTKWILGFFGIDAKTAIKVGVTVGAVLISAGIIAGATIAAAVGLQALGTLITISGWAIPLMFKGAAVFFMLAAPVVALVAGITAFALVLDKIFGLDNLVKAAKGFQQLIEATTDVAWTIIGLAPALSVLGLLDWWAPVVAGLMWAGVGAFFLMAAPVTALVTGLMMLAKAMVKQFPPAEAQKTAGALKDLFEAAGKVSETIANMRGELLKLGMMSLFSWLIIGLLNVGANMFMQMAKPVVKFTLSLMMMAKLIIGASGGLKGIKKVSEGMKALGTAIESIGKALDVLYKVVIPLTKKKWFGLFGNSKLEDLAEATPIFEENFKIIASFVRTGIVEPIKENFRNAKVLMKVTDVAKAMSQLIASIGPMLDGLYKTIMPLMSHPGFLFFSWGSSKLDKLVAAIPEFQASFAQIVTFIKDGMTKPIQRAFKDAKKVTATANIAKAISDAISQIAPMLDKLSETVSRLTERPGFLFFSWGSSQLQKLEKAIPEFTRVFGIIVDFVKNGVIKPVTRAFKNIKQVTNAIQIAQGIGKAVSDIAAMVDVLGEKIQPMTERGGLWSRLFGDARSKMEKIEAMMPDFARVFAIMVNFLKNSLIGIVVAAFPNLQAVNGVLPIVKGVGEAIKAIADSMDALVNKLAPMTERGGWWASMFGDARSPLEKLVDAMPTIKDVWNNIVYFVRDGLIEPVKNAFPDLQKATQAVELIKKVGDAVEAVSDILEKFQDISHTVDPWAGYAAIFGRTDARVSPIEAAIPTIKKTFDKITNFIQEGVVKPVQSMNVRGTEAAVKKLQLMAKSLEVMGDMIDTIQGISGFLGLWPTTITTTVDSATDQMNKAIPEIQKTFGKIMEFVKEGIIKPVQQLDGINMKSVIKTLEATAKALELVPDMIDNLDDAIKMMSPGDYMNTAYPMDRIIAGIKWFRPWFGTIAQFVKEGIIDPVMTHLGDIGKVKNAAKVMMATAMMLQKLPDMIDDLDDAIKMMSPGDYMNTAYPMDRIIAGMKWFRPWFGTIAQFVKEGIIDPIETQFGNDFKKILNVAKVMKAVAIMLKTLPEALNALDQAMGMMSPGEFMNTAYPMNRIIAGMKWFRPWFELIAKFVKTAIMEPVVKYLGDVKKVQNVAKIMRATACMIKALPPILSNLDQAMSMMSPGEYFNLNFPMDRIIKAIPWFGRWFKDIMTFINQAIVGPVMALFPDVKPLLMTAKALVAMAQIARSIPPVLTNLDQAMSMMLPGDYIQLDFPMNRIIKAIPWFSCWFKMIGQFMKQGIVDPVIEIFGDGKSLQTAARIIRAMTAIAMSLPPLLRNLAAAMGLMGDSRFIDQDFPMNRIIAKKDDFADWFKKIAIFMCDGIVNPILQKLREPRTIMLAGRILMAMAGIVRTVPGLIRTMANQLIPLIDTGMDINREAPMAVLIEYKDDFADWFEEIAIFMCDGIVNPILQKLREPRTIMLAGRILMAMAGIIRTLPPLLRSLVALFVPLNPEQCTREAPVAVLAANAPEFACWFWQVAAFLRVGIIMPIMTLFPDEKEIKLVADRLRAMNTVVGMLPPFLFDMADRMNLLTSSVYGLSSMARIAQDIGTFAGYFYGIANMMKYGIIFPIMTGFPKTEEVEEVEDRLNGMVQVLDKLPKFLDEVGVRAFGLLKGAWRNYFAALDIRLFAPYFWRLADALNYGIVMPIQTLPSSKALAEVNKQMTQMGAALDNAKKVLDAVGRNVQEFTGGWWWGSNFLRLLNATVFAAYFKTVAGVVRWGIIDPIQTLLPPSSDLKECVDQLDETANILNSLGDVMRTLADTMNEISALNIDWTPLQSVPVEDLALFVSVMQGLQDIDFSPAAAEATLPTSTATEGATEAAAKAAAPRVRAEGSGSAAVVVEDMEGIADPKAVQPSPSDKAIERGMMKDQADATVDLNDLMNQLIIKALKGEGLAVHDTISQKALVSVNQTQKDQERRAKMPNAAERKVMSDNFKPIIQATEQTTANAAGVNNTINTAIRRAQDSITTAGTTASGAVQTAGQGASTAVTTAGGTAAQAVRAAGTEVTAGFWDVGQSVADSIRSAHAAGNTQGQTRPAATGTGGPNDPLRPAAQTTQDANLRPAAANADMRPAAQSQQDSYTQRAEQQSQRERNSRNRYTERRDREAAARAARQQAGTTGTTATPSPTTTQIQQNTQQTSDAVTQMAQEATTAGSLYVHDIHMEGLMEELVRAVGGSRQTFRGANTGAANQMAQGGVLGYDTGRAAQATDPNIVTRMNTVAEPTSAPAVMPEPVEQVPTKPAITTIAAPSPMQPDVHQQVARDISSAQPKTTAITSPELGAMVSENKQQTTLLNQLVGLFGEIIQALQPKSEVQPQDQGQAPGDTNVNTVMKRPANYYRQNIGSMQQTPGKAVLNIGPQVF